MSCDAEHHREEAGTGHRTPSELPPGRDRRPEAARGGCALSRLSKEQLRSVPDGAADDMEASHQPANR